MTDLVQVLTGYVREVLDLRMGAELPATVAPADALASLQDIRRRIDRAEELHSRAIRVRARAHRAAHAADAEADDAWDQAIKRVRGQPVTPGGEYASARERHAAANLDIIDLRHTARRARETAHHCDEALDVIRLAHRGLDGVRQDALAVLRTYAFESHLER